MLFIGEVEVGKGASNWTKTVVVYVDFEPLVFVDQAEVFVSMGDAVAL